MDANPGQWTQDELISVANGVATMPASEPQPAFGERQVRFYRAQNLLDPPQGWRGKSPLFGRRHLRQLLAIRRLQSEGWSLHQIRTWLDGAGEPALREIVGDVDVVPAPPRDDPERGLRRARTAHWRGAAPEPPARAEAPLAVQLGPGAYAVIDRGAPGFDPRRVARALEELAAGLRGDSAGRGAVDEEGERALRDGRPDDPADGKER